MTEQWLTTKSPASAAVLARTVSEFPATALEVAADDMDAGLWQDGTALLTHIAETAQDKSKVSPLIYYDLAYFAGQMKQSDKAREYDEMAEKASPDYVFPFQMEMIAVLEDAMRVDPKDSRAPYYLGNLLYDWQPERAQALWEKSAALGADVPVVYRNLAMVYTRQGNQREKALAALEKGVQFGGNAMVLNDLDKLYEENGVSPAKRLALMETHQEVVDRDEVIAREINLEIFAGKPDEAIQLLRSRFFRAWEGGGSFSLGDSWINANLERGAQQMIAKQYALALADYQAALQVPVTLQEATGNGSGRRGEIEYWIGNAYQAMGDSAKAHSSWSDAAGTGAAGAGGPGANGPMRSRGNVGGLAAGVHVEQAAPYYQALALEKLGQDDRAKAIFTQLVDTGSKSLGSAPAMKPAGQSVVTPAQRAQVADAHYLVGLGQLGLNHTDQARQEFSLALEASPDHYAAMRALNDRMP
jgi:tetratricopeptide (TPR) repeat protein